MKTELKQNGMKWKWNVNGMGMKKNLKGNRNGMEME